MDIFLQPAGFLEVKGVYLVHLHVFVLSSYILDMFVKLTQVHYVIFEEKLFTINTGDTFMSDLVVVSYNVKGINHPTKRKKILAQLKKFICSIGLLQETHVNEAEHKKLRRDWVDQVFYASCPNSRKRGVAILISRYSSLAVHREVKDIQGRYIAIIGKIGWIDLTIMHIYTSNEEYPSFFKDIGNVLKKRCSILAREAKGTIILGGDFN